MRKFIKEKISIIIPTFNEENNIVILIDEIISEMTDKNYEIIIVDDGSTDLTVNNILEKFNKNEKVKPLQRQNDKGLVQSIKFGLQSMTGEYFVVMDGDRQHSASEINYLVNELKTNDLVIGVRNLKELDVILAKRLFLSKFFNKFLQFILSTNISDPLTGFFAGKVSLLNKKFFLLSNSGFKVLLDLIFSNKKKNIKIAEKEIKFESRIEGTSKLNSQVAFSFITQVLSYMFNGIISSRFIGFTIIGGIGFIFHFSILFSMYYLADTSFYISHLLATLFTATINFLANNYLNFYDNHANSLNKLMINLIKYYLINLPGIIASIGSASFAFNMIIKSPLYASLIGVILDTIFKYMISKTWIWKSN